MSGFDDAKRAYAAGELNTSFIDPTYGTVKYADVVTPGTYAYKIFNPDAQAGNQAAIDQAKQVFQAATGQELKSTGLDTVTKHILAGNSVEQALSNLGNLTNYAKFADEYNNVPSTDTGNNLGGPAPTGFQNDPSNQATLYQQAEAYNFANQLPGAPLVPSAASKVNISPVRTATNTVHGYDTNNNYAEVWVPPGYQPGISATPKQVTPGSFQSAGVPTVPSPSVGTTSAANGMIGGAQTSLAEIIKQITPPETPEDKQYQSILDEMVKNAGQLAQKAADQLTAEQSSQLPQFRQQFADINAQILAKAAEDKALDASYQQANTTVEGQPITLARQQGQEAQNYRMYLAQKNAKAAEIGLLQAQAQGLQGKITDAQNTVNRAIDLKYSVLEDQHNVYQAQLNAIQPILDKKEKIQAQAQQILLNQQQQALADQKAEQKNIQNLVLDAASKGASTAMLSAISNSKNSFEAANAYSLFVQSQFAPLSSSSRTSSPTSSRNVSSSSPSSPPSSSETTSPLVQSWVDAINDGKSTISSVPANLKNEVVAALSKTPAASKVNPELVDQAKQQVSLADSILNSSGLSGAVGPNSFARFRPIASLTGSTQNFISSVEQLTNLLTAKTLIDIKKSGGTFGALSERELELLQNAATKINSWALRDANGKVYAYKASEVDFRAEVNRIKDAAQKVVGSGVSTGNTTSGQTSTGLKYTVLP